MTYEPNKIIIDFIKILIMDHNFSLKHLFTQFRSWDFKFEQNFIINVQQHETKPEPLISYNSKEKVIK